MMLQKHHTFRALAGLAALCFLHSHAIAQRPNEEGTQQVSAVGEAALSAPVVLPSLMFSDADMSNLLRVAVALRVRNDRAVAATAPDAGQEALLDEIFANAQQKNPEVRRLPSFYLSSVLYRSPRDWKVWVRVRQGAGSRTVISKTATSLSADRPGADGPRNAVADLVAGQTQSTQETIVPIPAINKRISLSANKPENNQFGLRVLRISDDYVTLAYTPEDIQFAAMHYKKGNVLNVDGRAYRSRLVKDTHIQFDAEKKEFTTRLRSNQSFSMDLLKIVEGQYLPSDAPSAPPPQQVADADKSSENIASTSSDPQLDATALQQQKMLEVIDNQRSVLELLQQNRSDK